MSKLVSCSTGTQTPLISSCLSSVVSGNWGEEGTWREICLNQALKEIMYRLPTAASSAGCETQKPCQRS